MRKRGSCWAEQRSHRAAPGKQPARKLSPSARDNSPFLCRRPARRSFPFCKAIPESLLWLRPEQAAEKACQARENNFAQTENQRADMYRRNRRCLRRRGVVGTGYKIHLLDGHQSVSCPSLSVAGRHGENLVLF